MARPLSAALLLGWAASGVAWSDVVTESAEGFVVAHEMVLKATPARAFEALTTDIAAWWDATHSYSGEARNLSLPARAGDCFCERLPNGGSVEHMRVVLASPGERLRMVGGLGPLQQMGASGVMSFDFAPTSSSSTRDVNATHAYLN